MVSSPDVSRTDHLTLRPPPVSTPSRHRGQAFPCLSPVTGNVTSTAPRALPPRPPNEKTRAPSQVSATCMDSGCLWERTSPLTQPTARQEAVTFPGGLGSGRTWPSARARRLRAVGVRKAQVCRRGGCPRALGGGKTPLTSHVGAGRGTSSCDSEPAVGLCWLATFPF